MSKNKLPKNKNYELPKGFVLDWDVISHHEQLDTNGLKFTREDIFNDFNKYVKEDYLDVDCRTLAKEYHGLSKKPYGYRYGLIVFKIVSEDDFQNLEEAYPERYQPLEFRGTIEERIDNTLIKKELIESKKWHEVIKACIAMYFDPKKYKKSVPILIRYGRCGFWMGSTDTPWEYSKKGDLILKRNAEWFEHSPWIDDEYHKVFANVPIRISPNRRMLDFLLAVSTKVNEYYQDNVLKPDEFAAVWNTIVSVDSYLKQGVNLDPKKVVGIFNSRIENYEKKNFTPANAFYFKHFYDYLDDLQEKKFIKKCIHCYKAFEWSDKREYCTEQCRRSKHRRKDYILNIEKRRESARKYTRELREFYKEKGVAK